MTPGESAQRLTGKRIIVTGAAQGLGAATARYLADQGAHVALCDVQIDGAQSVADDILRAGGAATAIEADVSSPSDARRLVDASSEALGGLDGLVNNAGVLFLGGPLDDPTGAEGSRVLSVNLIGTYLVGTAMIGYLASRSGGAIVNITSGVQAGLGYGASYSASKGGVASLTYSWAIDCQPMGIRVNSVSPVATTPMVLHTERWMQDRGLLSGDRAVVPAERNCPAIGYLLSDLATGITGQILRVHDATLQLIAHPVVMDEVVQTDWTIDDIDAVVRTRFAHNLPPWASRPQMSNTGT